jgi:hypothetical protein
MTDRPYSLIVGQGRSGTNWLLQLFQLSPRTFCRNEPYALEGSPFQGLRDHQHVKRADRDDLQERWQAAVAHTFSHMGKRDPRLLYPKDYASGFGNGLGAKLIGKAKVRRLLGLGGDEWPIPGWYAKAARQAQAPAVLKLLQAPGWATFVLDHHPEVPVFHIVRHPGGFLNSWSNRYLADMDTEAVLQENRSRLQRVLEEAPEWSERFGDLDTLDVEASELWYWRYANETCFAAGQEQPQYRALAYEQLATDPLPLMEDLYAVADLPWDATIASRVTEACSKSAGIAGRWRTKLKPEQVAMVERILEGSPLQSLWPN